MATKQISYSASVLVIILQFIFLVNSQECGNFSQPCCCEIEEIVIDSEMTDWRKIMIGIPANNQTGCCNSDQNVCIAGSSTFDQASNERSLQPEDFGCYPRTIAVNRTFIEENTNYKGDLVQTASVPAPDAKSCGQECEQLDTCNAFVYCGKEEGCANADINVIPYQTCDLKFQEAVQQGQLPETFVKGKDVDFTSGFIRRGVVIEENANYKGDYTLLSGADNKQPSAEACADSCLQTERCNAFVFCGLEDGCPNADIDIIPHQFCDLKFQIAIHKGLTPEVWVRSPEVDFTSGYINRTVPCGYAIDAPCCRPSLAEEGESYPGVCISEDLYCNFASVDDESEFGHCKEIPSDLNKICGQEYGLCEDSCERSGRGDALSAITCPQGFACVSLQYSGIPGYEMELQEVYYCVAVPEVEDCGDRGQICCPLKPAMLSTRKQINAECGEGLVCVGADVYYEGKCYDYSTCGETNGECCPNLWGQIVNGKAASYAQCRDVKAWCNMTMQGEDSVCQLNAKDCGVVGEACCYSSPAQSEVPPLCNDGSYCDQDVDICVACNDFKDNNIKRLCQQQHCLCKPAGCSCTFDSV